MNHSDKIVWMTRWANRHGMTLSLEGHCGIGRECVGVVHDGNYPDYNDWSSDGPSNWATNLPEVWTPEDAYHKHPCVAVLGRGEAAEDQLYQWLKWFDDHNYRLETGTRDLSGKSQFEREIAFLLNQHVYCRLVPAVVAVQRKAKKAAKKKTVKKRVVLPRKKK